MYNFICVSATSCLLYNSIQSVIPLWPIMFIRSGFDIKKEGGRLWILFETTISSNQRLIGFISATNLFSNFANWGGNKDFLVQEGTQTFSFRREQRRSRSGGNTGVLVQKGTKTFSFRKEQRRSLSGGNTCVLVQKGTKTFSFRREQRCSRSAPLI